MSSLPKARDVAAKPNSNFTRYDQRKQQQAQAELQAAGSSFTLCRKENNTTSTTFYPSLVLAKSRKVEESDEDLFTVPDVESQPPAVKNAIGGVIKNTNDISNQEQQNGGLPCAGKRKRGRNPVDKEYRRIKRLLRNRVSAQQARERKKVYVNDMESRAKELQDENARLEERISTLTNENAMLRKVLMNTRPTKCDGSNEPKDGQLSKS